MCQVEARVKDSHDDAGAAGRDPPRFVGVDVGVGRAGEAVDRLAEVVEPPLQVESGVVGRGAVVGRLDAVVPPTETSAASMRPNLRLVETAAFVSARRCPRAETLSSKPTMSCPETARKRGELFPAGRSAALE
jgi:hypothetical protein